MYEQAQPDLDRILALVKTCPDDLQVKCFEILLNGYVQSLLSSRAPPEETEEESESGKDDFSGDRSGNGTGIVGVEVPQAARTRLGTLALRRKVPVEQLKALFDFSVDPFTFGPLPLEGKQKGDKARKIALLVGVKSWLMTGKWTADWDEVKAMCTDYSCYDQANFAQTMKNATDIFKNVTVSSSIEITSPGQEKAEALLTQLATTNAA